jgi:hypothetical protein
MSLIKIKIERTYKFVKGGSCDKCDLFYLCNEVDWQDCELGTVGHYEEDDEQIEQLQ